MNRTNNHNNNFLCDNLISRCTIHIDWFGAIRNIFDDTKPIINLTHDSIISNLSPICYQIANQNINYVFCRTEFLQYLLPVLHYYKLSKCILFTASDYLITDQLLPLIENPQIIHWFGHNIAIKHKKITPIPLGIRFFTNEETVLFDTCTKIDYIKSNLYDATFSLCSNEPERNKCMQKCQSYYYDPLDVQYPCPIDTNYLNMYLKLHNKENNINNSFDQHMIYYLQDRKKWHNRLGSSYFVLSPRGFSIPLSNQGDNHRIWEALYHKSIPVTTPSPLTDLYSNIFPILVIDDWDNFNPQMLTPELYHQMWKEKPLVSQYLKSDYFFEHIIKNKIKEYNI
jgi:hypothetical protein